MIGTILASAAALFAVPIVGGLAWRWTRRHAVKNALEITTSNGIAEQRFVEVGGIDQWIQIRGENRDNPVLLLLHGGPGWPNAVFNLPLRSWERHFTIVQWDHRGTGKTLGRTGKAGTGEMTFDRRVADAIELIEYLRRYLNTDKVIVLAESMGTLTGLPLVKRRPDLVSALVVTDLYVDMARNEAHKYQLTLERLRAAGHTKGVAALEKIGGDPAQWDLRAWNTNMAFAFKTNLPTPNLDRRLLIPLAMSSPIYSLRDLLSVFVGFQWSTARMFEEFRAFDARRLGSRFEVPFLVLQGASDVITLTSLAEEYYKDVEAPSKRFTLIEDAGHFAAFTHPEQFLAELLAHVHTAASTVAPDGSRGPQIAEATRAPGLISMFQDSGQGSATDSRDLH